MTRPILETNALGRTFGSVPVLKDVSLAVEAGVRLGVHGANGAGKTTLLRCIVGSLLPSTGEVLVEGHRAGSLQARRLVGASLSQERSFYLRLTGRDNLLFFARMRGMAPKRASRAVDSMIAELELEAICVRRADRCSTGMIQQLALARSLLADPKLLVLDEPTRSLDEAAVERLWRALDERSHLAVVFASHRPEDLERCTRVLELGN